MLPAKQDAVKHSVPDAFLMCPEKRAGDGDTYIIAEIKYCRDTDPAQQLQRAREQHAELAHSVSRYSKARDRVCQVPILLGVSGTIFKRQTVNTLKRLGVDGDLLTKLKYRLHRIAVKHLHRIHTAKRKQEKHLEGTATGGCQTSNTSKRPVQKTGWDNTDSRRPDKRRKS
jgi:hypothetical protein